MIANFISRLQGVKRTPRGYIARCPSHTDKSPSLSLKETSSGDVLLHCFAGCSFGDILSALGMEAKDCFADRGKSTRTYRIQHEVHAVHSEVDVLTRHYGLSDDTARRFVQAHRLRQLEGLI